MIVFFLKNDDMMYPMKIEDGVARKGKVGRAIELYKRLERANKAVQACQFELASWVEQLTEEEMISYMRNTNDETSDDATTPRVDAQRKNE